MKALLPKLIPAMLAALSMNASAATRFVDFNSPSPTPPYTNWPTAATNIQEAIDAAVIGDEILVASGIYQIGVTANSGSNRVAITKAVTVRAINGPLATIIKGYQIPGTTNGTSAIRCVYLANGATLTGFTLTNGATSGSGNGGGIYCQSTLAKVSNCLIVGNSAGSSGGGSYSGSFDNCVFIGNSAATGGGNSGGLMNNCTVIGNSATSAGGGVWGNGDWTNSIIYFNTAPNFPNYRIPNLSGPVTFCCTTPLPVFGRGATGNITNDPVCIDQVNGNLRLQFNSPCLNAGINASLTTGTDFDGNLRIVGGTVDIGASEYQSPASVLSYAWLQQYELSTDGSTDFADTDGDGVNNYGEWRADTIPTNTLSVLRMVNVTNSPTGAQAVWQSVSTRNYWLERATNLGSASPFQTISTNIPGVAGVKTFTDTSATNGGPYFYRVGVQ